MRIDEKRFLAFVAWACTIVLGCYILFRWATVELDYYEWQTKKKCEATDGK